MQTALTRRVMGLESQFAALRRGTADTAAAWTLRFRRAHPDHEAAYQAAVGRMVVHTPGLVRLEEPGPDVSRVVHSFIRQVGPPIFYRSASAAAWTDDRAEAAMVARSLYRHLRRYQVAECDPCPSADGLVVRTGGERGEVMIDLLCVPDTWPSLLAAIAALEQNQPQKWGAFR